VRCMPGSEGQRTWDVQASMRGSCAVGRLERTVLMAPLARRVRGKPRRPKGRDATDMASSGLLVARRLKIPFALATVTPGCVVAMPTSLKVRAAIAPASRIASASRIREMPVSFAAATRSPPRVRPRTNSVAATVLPAFMQVPAT